MNVEIKPFLDGAGLTMENTPAYGDMPDIAMAFPWVTGVENDGAVWPWRIFLGSEDDENRKKVYEWRQVDDLGGLAQLWAGMYNGTLYLYAGDGSPTAGQDDFSDMTGAPIGGADDVWRTGQPILPPTVVEMADREQMLKNSNGQWRRMYWEPIGLFDVAPHKNMRDPDGSLNIERHTLYMVVEYPFIAFYTTKARLDAATQQDGAPARWPFSYYGELTKAGQPTEYAPGGNDGGYAVGWNNRQTGYRLAPLPWQTGTDGELEAAEDAVQYDGVQEGQCYTMPLQYPCGRYLTAMGDVRISAALVNLYQDGGEHQEYRKLDKTEARAAIVDTIREAATQSYSIDPALMEELGRTFPEGAQEGSIWVSDPPAYEVAFSLHLDEQADRWPHWLAFMACHAPTALLTASTCAWYNDFRPADEPGEDEEDTPPSEGDNAPDDPNGTPEEDPETEDDIGGGIGGGGGSGGGGGGGDDEGGDDGGGGGSVSEPLPSGYYYEAGTGVSINSVWDGNTLSWKQTLMLDPITVAGGAMCATSMTAFTTNATTQYDYPDYGYSGLSMYYGISANSDFSVAWKSSLAGGDNLSKSATARKEVERPFNATVLFGDVGLTTSVSPANFGNLLSVTYSREIKKRGWVKKWDSFAQKYVRVRAERSIKVYNVSLNRATVVSMVRGRASSVLEQQNCTVSPKKITGHSDDIDGPTVTAGDAFSIGVPTAAQGAFGVVKAQANILFPAFAVEFKVEGNSSWNSTRPPDPKPQKFGSISGAFTATLSEITASIKL